MSNSINFKVYGSVPSKSNSYKLGVKNGKPIMFKSKMLTQYEKNFYLQTPATARDKMLSGLLAVYLNGYYTSNRLDLDNSAKILLDCMEAAKIFKNDNQVTSLFMNKFVDNINPRVEIAVMEN